MANVRLKIVAPIDPGSPFRAQVLGGLGDGDLFPDVSSVVLETTGQGLTKATIVFDLVEVELSSPPLTI